jgi:hypothetical protein
MEDLEPNFGKQVHSGMKNSSPSTAPAIGSDACSNQELSPLEDAGLTCPGSAASGGARRGDSNDAPFVLVRSKRARGLSGAQKEEAQPAVAPPSPQLDGIAYADPFGLANVPEEVNPLTHLTRSVRSFVHARTKQTVRKAKFRAKKKPSPTGSSGSNNSDRSKARLVRLGFVQAAKVGDKKKLNPFVQRALDLENESSGWDTTTGGESDADSDSGSKPTVKLAATKSLKVDPPGGEYQLEEKGRFNGRIHPTPNDGSCGPESLLAALHHLSSTQGYEFVIPDNAQALRQQIVDYISDNIDVAAASSVRETDVAESWLECIAREYFPEEEEHANRSSLWALDVNQDQSIFVDNIEQYLQAIALPHTHMDEFMITAFACMWEVRVAVFHYQKRVITSDHTQYVPDAPVEAKRTVYLLNRSNHFEWAHPNGEGCAAARCHASFRRISARHTPFHVPPKQADPNPPQGGSTKQQQVAADEEQGELIARLREEYVDLSPERAEAALKLTKQNGRYNIYKNTALLGFCLDAKGHPLCSIHLQLTTSRVVTVNSRCAHAETTFTFRSVVQTTMNNTLRAHR